MIYDFGESMNYNSYVVIKRKLVFILIFKD